MKTKFIILGLLVVFAMPAFAQIDIIPEQRHEISIGYGHVPASGFGARLNDLHYPQATDKVGAIYGTYTFRINGELGVGLTYCYDLRRLSFFSDKARQNAICDLDESSHTVVVHVKSNWLNHRWFSLYSKGAIGMAFWGYKLTEYHPDMYEIRLPSDYYCFAYQLVPIGIELGSERLAGFFQVGLGMEGLLSAGLRFRF